MADLPNEIIHQILREYQGETFTCVLPLVCIHRSWQAVAESYLWLYLRIRPRQIGCFRAAFNENPRPRRALRSLDIRFEYYFALVVTLNVFVEVQGCLMCRRRISRLIPQPYKHKVTPRIDLRHQTDLVVRSWISD